MAVTIPATGSGTATPIVATESISSEHYQFMKLVDGGSGSTVKLNVVAEDQALSGGEGGILAMAQRKDAPANNSGTDGDAEYIQMSGGRVWVTPLYKDFDVSVDITRPADTVAYAVGDALSDSTSAPTSGGFTFAVARASGGSVYITDAYCYSSNDPATPLQCELFLFNTSVTNINDNTAFAVSDSEIKTLVGDVQFALRDVGNNDMYHAQNLGITATCSGSANLRGLVRVLNAYTPASAEVITFRLRGFQID